MVEDSAVQPEGRITPWDLGLWSDVQSGPLQSIVEIIDSRDATPAIQLAHAGRKASHDKPWAGGGFLGIADGGWDIVAPSAESYDDDYGTPQELSLEEGAVGLITKAQQAEQILADESADAILLGRELLRNPYWPIHAKAELDGEVGWPSQYLRVAEMRQFIEAEREAE